VTARSAEALRYLEADHVESPIGSLGHLELCTMDDEKLGVLDGVLIDPAARRLRYFVVKSSGWFSRGRYILSADDVARVEADQHILRIDAPAAALPRESFDPGTVREFSDEDVITALFPSNAA
jgi:PRC-barrel domain